MRQIVLSLTADGALHDDLTQEALIHLWLREQQCPGQTQSWYFQSCRFFLQNYLRTGRCVHSVRHYKNLCSPVELKESEAVSSQGQPFSSDSVLSLVSAREIISLLANWLTPLERQVFGCLAEGFGVRETAGQLNVSHTCVIRQRRRIAAVALTLGIEPMPNGNGTNGHRPADGQVKRVFHLKGENTCTLPELY